MTKRYRNVRIDADGLLRGEVSHDDGRTWPGTFTARQDLALIELAIARGRLAATIWSLQDGYGEAGYTPGQGWDWSGIRDSSDTAVAAMAAVAATAVSRADFLAAYGIEEVPVAWTHLPPAPGRRRRRPRPQQLLPDL